MEIVPFRSVGELTFGDTREVARSKLSSPFSTFHGLQMGKSDYFDDLALSLRYDGEGQLQMVEAHEPAVLTLRGKSFLGRDLESVIREMSNMGYESITLDVVTTFVDVGIALAAPHGTVELIAAFAKRSD